jgi:glycosyltransferase involved in cell wall biosynthesis
VRLGIVASHPVQYHAPLFRELAKRVDLEVCYAHRATAQDQGAAGFGVAFEWDSDLLSDYAHTFLRNVSKAPGPSRFAGCDTPAVADWVARGRFDAVLVMGWHLKSYWQATFGCLRRGIPVMVRGDSQLVTRRSVGLRVAKRLSYPAGLRLFSAALYVGERSRAYFAHYGVPARRLFFSPHGIDEDWFSSRATGEARDHLRSRLGLALDATLLLFAGKLVDFKRPVDVIHAAALMRADGAPVAVAVAGDGPLAFAVRAAAADAGVPLHPLGFLNQSEMPAAYAAANVLALPSNGRETWGLVANEALACGAPIVVSDAVGCAPDLAGDASVGRTYPLGDIAGLARSLQEVLAQRPGRAAMRSKVNQYGLGSSADGIIAAAESSVSRRRKSSSSIRGASSPSASAA